MRWEIGVVPTEEGDYLLRWRDSAGVRKERVMQVVRGDDGKMLAIGHITQPALGPIPVLIEPAWGTLSWLGPLPPQLGREGEP